MKASKGSFRKKGKLLSVAGCILLLGLAACAQKSPDRIKLDTLLDEYEAIVEKFIPEMERAKDDFRAYLSVVANYSAEVTAWSKKWEQMSAGIDRQELVSVKNRLDNLNKKVIQAMEGNPDARVMRGE